MASGASDPVIRRSAERMLKRTEEEETFPPHGEEQSIIDHLERPVYDDDFVDDFDDWVDME